MRPLRLGVAGVLALLSLGNAARASDRESFRERIAPILEARCLRCHGGTATKGGLSLATAEAARAGGDSGPAVEPGKPDESLLLDMISGAEPEMPRGGKPLSADDVATLRRWIEAGADWPKGLVLREPKPDQGPWWPIQPLNRPDVPQIKGHERVRSPIDAFILKALQTQGLTPSPEADRRTLIRRLTFDLHGLPPTPSEIDSFEQDDRPDAYERLVDRLLGSPRYGERWGRHWLDVVHYGDTHGFDKDKRRDHAWPYRDYVIRSLNADKPYAQFVREQLAGDVLEPGDPDGLIATGFNAAGPWDFVGHVELREGTVEKRKTRLLDRDDMLANAISTFNSLTVHCARCHDHKFDPIPQRDYYRLQAVFAGIDRGDRPFASPSAAARRLALQSARDAAFERHKANVQRAASKSSPELVRLDATLDQIRQEFASLPPHKSTEPSPSNGYHSAIYPNPDANVWVQVDLGRSFPITEVRLVPARPTDFPDTPGFGFPSKFRITLGDDPDGQDAATVADEVRPDQPNHVDEADIFRPVGRSGRFVRVAASRLWKRSGDFVFALAELEAISEGKNVALGAMVKAHDSIEAGRWSTRFLVDGFDSRGRRPESGNPDAAHRASLRFQIQEAERARQRVSEALIDPGLRSALATSTADLIEADAQLAAQPGTDLVYAVLPHAPRPISLLRRGDVEQPAEPVGPGALSCLPGLDSEFPDTDDEGARRAALADWIADTRNVLTWRSIVNRVWHYHFGRGIVDTPNDFGRNGSNPTHPELLDWLAVEFRDSGQSLKALHRLIVTSATYRQSSKIEDANARLDADNRYLWRMNRRRLEAEEVRDSVLAVSGQLDDRMSGPGFELFRFKDDHSPIYDHEALDKINSPLGHRRAVYRFIVRSVPNPFVECLDGADPNANTPVRNSTITALQALTLLNDPFMLDQFRAFAARLEGMSPDPDERMESAYRLAFGRRPNDAERAALVGFAKHHGLAAACRIIFNANEFHFID